MASTTFGYDKREDRVWLSFDDTTPRLWLTRRMVSHLLGPMLKPFEVASPGGQGGAQAGTRVALEHEIAMNESLPGETTAPLKMGTEAESDRPDTGYMLCTGLTASFDPQMCRLAFMTDEGERGLHINRIAMHRWLRALHMVMQHGEWGLSAPEWLTRSCLPQAMRTLVQDATSKSPPNVPPNVPPDSPPDVPAAGPPGKP